MRLVLDTNIVVSALLWKGSPHALLAQVRERPKVTLYTSAKLLAELADILSRKKLATFVRGSGHTPEALMQTYLNVTRIIATPQAIPRVVVRDPDDDHVVACALAAQTDLIVSGDGDLLELKAHRGIRIVSAVEALRLIGKP